LELAVLGMLLARAIPGAVLERVLLSQLEQEIYKRMADFTGIMMELGLNLPLDSATGAVLPEVVD
tara:strand:- start:203 stop:397 length:195 start_codon:yes stop_codon:yes gene_type:complete